MMLRIFHKKSSSIAVPKLFPEDLTRRRKSAESAEGEFYHTPSKRARTSEGVFEKKF